MDWSAPRILMQDVTGELDKELAPVADWLPTFHAATSSGCFLAFSQE
jgi:hypothetical protein